MACPTCRQPHAGYVPLFAEPTCGAQTSPSDGTALKSTGANTPYSPLSVDEPSPAPTRVADWPLSFPLITWQLWDPEVPLSMIERHTEFRPQETITTKEAAEDTGSPLTATSPNVGSPRSTGSTERCNAIYAFRDFIVGDEVAWAGGVVVRNDDDVLATCASRCVPLSLPVVSPRTVGAKESRDEATEANTSCVPIPYTLIVTNELQHLRRARDVLGVTNVAPRLSRDRLGCVYVAYIAVRPIAARDELLD